MDEELEAENSTTSLQNLLEVVEKVAETQHEGRMALFRLGSQWMVMLGFSGELLTKEGRVALNQSERYDNSFEALRHALLEYAGNTKLPDPFPSEARPGDYPLLDEVAEMLQGKRPWPRP